MTNIQSFDSSNIDTIQKDINEALTAVLAKHGISHSCGNIRFNAESYSTKLTISVGDVMDAKRAEFARHCRKFGLVPEDFNRTFTHAGTEFTVVGIKPKSRKYPILASNNDGDVFKFPTGVLAA